MKKIILLFTTLVCLNISAETRTFTGKDGRKVRGEIIKYDSSTREVTIKLESGIEVKAEVRDLCRADQIYVSKWKPEESSKNQSKTKHLEITGFEISFPDGCRINLSIHGDIKSIILSPGDIKKDSSNKIKSVGTAEVKYDSSGDLKNVGRIYFQRDSSGKIKSVGGIEIKRDSAGRIKRIGGAEIRRDSFGKIKSVYDNTENVQPLFSLVPTN